MKREHLLLDKCSWTRCSNAKFITGTSIFLFAILRFSFRKKALKMLSFEVFFTPNGAYCGLFGWNACTRFQKIWGLKRYERYKYIRNTKIFLVAFLRFCLIIIASKMASFQGFFYLYKNLYGLFWAKPLHSLEEHI